MPSQTQEKTSDFLTIISRRDEERVLSGRGACFLPMLTLFSEIHVDQVFVTTVGGYYHHEPEDDHWIRANVHWDHETKDWIHHPHEMTEHMDYHTNDNSEAFE